MLNLFLFLLFLLFSNESMAFKGMKPLTSDGEGSQYVLIVLVIILIFGYWKFKQ